MNFSISDFEKNLKNKTAIVCPDACGPSVLLTAEFFENDQAFAFWKSVSDNDYRLREKANRRENYHTVFLSDLPETLTATSGADVALFMQLDAAAERSRLREIKITLRAILTPTQLRRFWLCAVYGCSRSELAVKEGVTSSAIVKSIRQARRRIVESGIF